MSGYTLILVRVPPGASDEEIEEASKVAFREEDDQPPGPPDPSAEERKRALVAALVEACPELEGSEPNYVERAKLYGTTEEEVRRRHRYWQVFGSEEGAGIEITVYDTFVSLEMTIGGTDEDREDVWRYLEILVREGGFRVWDPQGPNVVDLEGGPHGDGKRLERPKPTKQRKKKAGKRAEQAREGDQEDEDDREETKGDVEPEDVRRGGAVAKLINGIVDEAIAAQLAAAGYKRSGRTWRKYLDNGFIQVVNIQWSPRREAEGWFTLNAGVYVPELAKVIEGFPVTKTPKEYECHLRKRPLVPGVGGWEVRVPGMRKADPDLGNGWFQRFFTRLDRRDDAKAPDQQERATRELRESLERYTFPWFERLSSLRSARDGLLDTKPASWAAHLSLLLGERDVAQQIIQRGLKAAGRNKEYAETLRAWARTNGLDA